MKFTIPKSLSMMVFCSCTIMSAYAQQTVQLNPKNVLVAAASGLEQNLLKNGLVFTPNEGQVVDEKGDLRPDVLFTTHDGSTQIFLSANTITYQFTEFTYPDSYLSGQLHRSFRNDWSTRLNNTKHSTHRFTLTLLGANKQPRIRKEALTGFVENFYLDHCPQGITEVHTYGRVVVEEVYPGIDWVIYAGKTGIEYDFLIHPNADPTLVKMKITDADNVQLTDKGELLITTRLGTVKEAAPVSFSGTTAISTRFKIDSDGTIGFTTGKYDRAQSLRIDPSVSWATYYGGTGVDAGNNTITDASGNIYLAGTTQSPLGIASSGGFQTTYGGNNFEDAFLVKFSTTGTRLWATYYGGSGIEEGFGCAIDGTGNVYLSGSTSSSSAIATSGTYQSSFGSGIVHGFLAKFNSAGARLWGTYIGGNDFESLSGCVLDASGNIYVSGNTSSTSGIATSGAYQTTYGGGNNDVLLAKFSSAGARMWSTYIGGASDDQCAGSAIDHSGNICLTGITTSTNGIATSGAFQSSQAGSLDAYLVKFSSSGARVWGTYFGGSADESGFAVAVDATDNVYLGGASKSSSGIASSGAFQTTFGGNTDFFLAKFSSTGSRQWSTYLGGSGADWGNGCTVDASNNVYISGQSTSTSGIASNGSQNTSGGGNDAVLAKFNSSGARQWSTYFGSSGDDRGLGCTTDPSGNIILTGITNSTSGIATTNAHQQTFGGDMFDAFLAKFSPTASSVPFMGSGSGMSLFPNPVKKDLTLTIDLEASKQVSYVITDVAGHIVSSGVPSTYVQGKSDIHINAETWPQGIYIVQLQVADQVSALKVVKE